MRNLLVTVPLLLGAVVVAVFAYLNAAPVAINFYFHSSSVSLALLLALAFCVGVLLSALLLLPRAIARRRRNNHLARQLEEANKELARLRNGPWKDVD